MLSGAGLRGLAFHLQIGWFTMGVWRGERGEGREERGERRAGREERGEQGGKINLSPKFAKKNLSPIWFTLGKKIFSF